MAGVPFVQLNDCKISGQFVNQYVSVSAGAQQQSHVIRGSRSPTHLRHTVAMRAHVHGHDGIVAPKIPDQHVPLRNHTNAFVR